MTKAPTLAVVIATCRPESFARWFDAWAHELKGVSVYVVEDQPEKTDDLQFLKVVKGWKHYSWKEIDKDLGDKSWVIPRRTSAIKSYGFLKAYQAGHDYIWTLDDDCFPEEEDAGYVDAIKWELAHAHPDDSWYNTIYWSGLYPRGYPYGIRQEQQQVAIHHGLWSGVPDLDGITALEHSKLRLDPVHGVRRVPTGQFFPMCGMNLAFRREMVPAMYFMLQGRIRDDAYDHMFPNGTNPLPFDRFDDIWAGLFAKKICDHLGYAVTSGGPSIFHTKESDPTMRVIKEAPGIAVHEKLWREVKAAELTGTTVAACYRQLSGTVHEFSHDDPERSEYWKLLANAMVTWTEFFDE
jgi:reversibly glycosylated polypeptide/UDP-arabinopyranose mutase